VDDRIPKHDHRRVEKDGGKLYGADLVGQLRPVEQRHGCGDEVSGFVRDCVADRVGNDFCRQKIERRAFVKLDYRRI